MGEYALKTEMTLVTITEEMVQNYEAIFGKQHRLPPTFPMLFYRYIHVPWDYKELPIHRKQTCVCHQGTFYRGKLSVCCYTGSSQAKRNVYVLHAISRRL